MKLDQIEAFTAVVEQKSITQAAKHLCLTSSAVSQKITALEERYKVGLFNRTGRNISVTPAGEKLYQCCKDIIRNINDAEAVMSNLHEQPEGVLKIYIPVARFIFSELQEFIKLHPSITLEIDSSERIPTFSFENLDLIFGFPSDVSHVFPENTVQKKLGSSEYIYCASPAYLKKFKEIKSPKDLKDHSIIVHAARPNNSVIEFRDKSHNIKIKPSLVVNDTNMLINSALNGIGIIRMGTFMIREYLDDGRLIRVLPKLELPELGLSLYYPYAKNMRPALRCFIDFMTNKLQGWPGV